MISKETCVKIWTCYNEIEKAEELLNKTQAANKDKAAPDLENDHGNRTGHTFGMATDYHTHQLYHVEPDLGVKIIRAHIRRNKIKLRELAEVVKREMKATA